MLVIFLTFNAVYWLFFLIRFTIHFPFPEGDSSHIFVINLTSVHAAKQPNTPRARHSKCSVFFQLYAL